MGEAAAANLGGARHEIGVRRRTDAHHEHPAAADFGGQRVEHLLLVADGPVGEEDHLAERCHIHAVRIIQRLAQGRDHFGAAFGLKAADIVLGDAGVLWRGGDSLRENRVHRVVKADDIEPVSGVKAAQAILQAGLGLAHRGAAHRAGIVDDEDYLARAALLVRNGFRWRHI